MPCIRQIRIENFRGIQKLEWYPQPGINALIGPGDTGKSTILDAIDWCLGTRRTLPITDADFHNLDTNSLIRVAITIGDLDNALKSLERYGNFLRGFDTSLCVIDDEPGQNLEDVLSIELVVGDDLEPSWTLLSDRALAQGLSRNLGWSDRRRLAPLRIGSFAARHLGFQRGSILHALSDEELNVGAALATASRHARESFGDQAEKDLKETLKAVHDAAQNFGVSGAEHPRAMLDPDTVSLSGGAISLHSRTGVPLGKLGIGSSRLLVAGLHGNATGDVPNIVLVDELEHGLEPHRIARFLAALGSKKNEPTQQVFLTTHSPVVLRELGAKQLYVVRRNASDHVVLWAGAEASLQGPIRSSAEGFLGMRVLVCEGATEVGLIRGIDLYRSSQKQASAMAAGLALVDARGVDKIYGIANAFRALGYPTAVLRDDDKQPKERDEKKFQESGGQLFKWADGNAIEDELFTCLPVDVRNAICFFAASIHGQNLIEDHIKSALGAKMTLAQWCDEVDTSDGDGTITAKAAKSGAWLKQISIMEEAALNHIAPGLPDSINDLKSTIDDIFAWALANDGHAQPS